MKTDALLQLPHLWNATKKGSLSRSNQHLPGDVENHAYLGGVPVSFQNMNQFILFCWLAARQFWLAAVICNPGWAQIIISNDFCHHPGWGGDINTQTADGVAASSLTWLHTSGCSWVLLLVGLCSVTPPPRPPGREPDDPLPSPPLPHPSLPRTLLSPAHTSNLLPFTHRGWKWAGRREERVSLMADRRSWRWHLTGRVMVVDTSGGLLGAAPRDAAFGRVHSCVGRIAPVFPRGSDSCKSVSNGKQPRVFSGLY